MRNTMLLLLLLIAPCACQSSGAIYQGRRAIDSRDAGSVHLSVLAVAPWSDYASAMQPNFQLTADAALGKVAADGRWASEDRANAIQAGQQAVALDRVNGGARPLEFPGLKPPGSGPDANGSTGGTGPMMVPAPAPGQESATGPDAMLKYTAATALFQEVQLLNRYIRDAAIPNGYRPYMVRVQVSLMPSRRHAPYDAYTTISFFIPGDRTAASVPNPGSHGGSASLASSNSDGIFEEPFGNGAKVLPLLVTDNLEAGIQARSLERIRSLIYSSAQFPGLSVVEEMLTGLVHSALREQVLGRDLNSLLTVARLSENTLRIRIGAVQEATADYAMVPRNHNITLLLMVPEGSPPLMEVVSRTELVDAETSETLVAPESGWTEEVLRKILHEQRLERLDTGTLRTLLDLAERNDQREFSSLLRSKLPAGDPALGRERMLWIELVTLLDGSRLNSHLFELPGQGENLALSSEVFEGQTVVVEDDGQESRVTLREARFPEFERILATLSVAESDPQILLPSRSVEVDPSRRELRVSFTSLRRLQFPVSAGPKPLKLHLSWGGESRNFDALYREVSSVEVDPAGGSASQRSP